VVHEVSIQDNAWASSGEGARLDTPDLRNAGRRNRKGRGIAGPHTPAVVGAGAIVTCETGAVHQGTVQSAVTAEFPELRKRYWGQHMWARGYFCATVGAVDEATIKTYVESQKWDEDDEGFKITAPTEP
jgi:hypothetical protein